jgi:hypothetical protein
MDGGMVGNCAAVAKARRSAGRSHRCLNHRPAIVEADQLLVVELVLDPRRQQRLNQRQVPWPVDVAGQRAAEEVLADIAATYQEAVGRNKLIASFKESRQEASIWLFRAGFLVLMIVVLTVAFASLLPVWINLPA